jgi:uncharacterized protein (TIGR03503 family)
VAIFLKTLFTSILILFSIISAAHTIYAPNDIPLLDNRFRIDPKTEQATFIFNHQKSYQRVVLVKPDGSKLHIQRHPDNVAWVSTNTQDIVTIQNPMAGPWQAIAKLDGDNRIQILTNVELVVTNLPLKLYAQEYITTHASLYADKKLMDNPAYISGAKLSISLRGAENKKMELYLDDGRYYDELSFDGKLTAHMYVDLMPGRYLLHIRTKNNVFIRNVNKDAVVFLSPITYKLKALKTGSDEIKISVTADISEIDPDSVSINGAIKNEDNKIVQQVLMHSVDNVSKSGRFSATYKLPYSIYKFSGKAYATTLTGREIELQLPNESFELIPKFEMPEINISEALATQAAIDLAVLEELESSSLFSNLWIIIAISVTILLLIAGIVFFLLKRKQKQAKNEEVDGEDGEELNLDELQPMPIDVTDSK